jgi:hypothetical protein
MAVLRVLVCGDRNYRNYHKIFIFLSSLSKESVVIEGGARGADSWAAVAAKVLGLKVIEYIADWNTYGRSAGPRRNQQMLDEGRPDLVVAFHDNLEASKGTSHMLKIAREKGVATLVNPEVLPEIFKQGPLQIELPFKE